MFFVPKKHSSPAKVLHAPNRRVTQLKDHSDEVRRKSYGTHGEIIGYLNDIWYKGLMLYIYIMYTLNNIYIMVIWIQNLKWEFPYMGVPQNGWFIMENPTNK